MSVTLHQLCICCKWKDLEGGKLLSSTWTCSPLLFLPLNIFSTIIHSPFEFCSQINWICSVVFSILNWLKTLWCKQIAKQQQIASVPKIVGNGIIMQQYKQSRRPVLVNIVLLFFYQSHIPDITKPNLILKKSIILISYWYNWCPSLQPGLLKSAFFTFNQLCRREMGYPNEVKV